MGRKPGAEPGFSVATMWSREAVPRDKAHMAGGGAAKLNCGAGSGAARLNYSHLLHKDHAARWRPSHSRTLP